LEILRWEVEDYETDLIENARREVGEEMGIDIKTLNENPFITHTTKQTKEGIIDVILVHYLAERIGEIKSGKRYSRMGLA